MDYARGIFHIGKILGKKLCKADETKEKGLTILLQSYHTGKKADLTGWQALEEILRKEGKIE